MRQIVEYAKMAIRNITGNKMRSVLTMLGIIIGIAAVIVVLCIGGGGQQQIEEQLSGISNGSVYLMASGDDITTADMITVDDIAQIKEMSEVAAISMVAGGSGSARGTRDSVAANVQAGNGDMNIVMTTKLLRGRFWNETDFAAARKVCTVDADGARELFGSDNVLGMTMELTLFGRTAEFTIVGITETTQMNMGRDVVAQITAPASSLEMMSDQLAPPYTQLALIATQPTRSAQVARQAINMLELRHGNAGRDMYFVLDIGQFMEEINSVTGLFTTIIAAIAGISLLVGGIGVMNIMLVSVTERTREIGIRKALGAKTSTILFQFLIESATLTLVGGVIGIILGSWGGQALGSLMDINASISWGLMVGIALFSSAIGIFFGIYPARKAAKLNPIEALRSD